MLKLCLFGILYYILVFSVELSCLGITRVGATFSGGPVDNCIYFLLA